MNTIFLLILFLSTPNQPSVKHNAILYFTEQECLNAKIEYMRVYNKKNIEYKSRVKTKALCVPFEAFPLTTMQKT